MENKIFVDFDYFELTLLNFEQFGIDKYDYHSLKKLTQIILDEVGYIPDTDCDNSDYSFVCSLIENYKNKHFVEPSYRNFCFVYFHNELNKYLHCRVIEKPFNVQDGDVLLFRTKEFDDNDFYMGINFKHEKLGSKVLLCSPNLAYNFFFALHQEKPITLEKTEILYSRIYAEKNFFS